MTNAKTKDVTGHNQPCPFCGTNDVDVETEGDVTICWFIKCNQCQAHGPVVVGGKGPRARKFWNERQSLDGFNNECQNKLPITKPIAKYAKEYHDTCDAFDKTFCLFGRPKNERDLGLINRHARLVIQKLALEIYVANFASSQQAAELILGEEIRAYPNL